MGEKNSLSFCSSSDLIRLFLSLSDCPHTAVNADSKDIVDDGQGNEDDDNAQTDMTVFLLFS